MLFGNVVEKTNIKSACGTALNRPSPNGFACRKPCSATCASCHLSRAVNGVMMALLLCTIHLVSDGDLHD